MLWNGLQFVEGITSPEILSFEKEEPWLHRIVPDVVPALEVNNADPTLPVEKAGVFEETTAGLKIRCDKQDAILEIVDPRMFRPEREMFCRVLRSSAIGISGALAVDLDLPAHSCRFYFEPDRFDEAELARRVVLAIEAATVAMQLDASSPVDKQIAASFQETLATNDGSHEPPVTTDSARWLCLAWGGGSLVAAVAGLILPGIPSAPFFLFSAHYFMKSSTTFKRWLDDMPRVREIVRKLEESGGKVLDRSMLLKSLGMAILLGLLLVVFHPPLPLVMAIELGLTVLVGLREVCDFGSLSSEISKVFA